MYMFSQAIDIVGWQLGRQLKVLVRKHQWSKCCVKPERETNKVTVRSEKTGWIEKEKQTRRADEKKN